ncbi:DUF7674 family protein [Allofustis seminis]|uniref:DUF7674 family protein n=1 Tax=Allofustis seminis TaxID=166939 RepID=UPI003CCBB94F
MSHTVFSFVFVPILKRAICNDEVLAKEMFNYLEEMENADDGYVSEVSEFTVLEEIADEFKDIAIKGYMGPETLKAFKLIRRYITGP